MNKPRKLKPYGFPYGAWDNIPALGCIVGYLEDLRNREEARKIGFRTSRELRHNEMCDIIDRLNEIDDASQ